MRMRSVSAAVTASRALLSLKLETDFREEQTGRVDDKQDCAITNSGAASRQAQPSKDKAMEVLILEENHTAPVGHAMWFR